MSHRVCSHGYELDYATVFFDCDRLGQPRRTRAVWYHRNNGALCEPVEPEDSFTAVLTNSAGFFVGTPYTSHDIADAIRGVVPTPPPPDGRILFGRPGTDIYATITARHPLSSESERVP